ncbi:MAG: hypothetical protein SFX18_03025, partial [Pirellulales bacterium]|nr:hypothetical protein [Pirellulales bacterium]
VRPNYDAILIGNESANYIQPDGGNDQLRGLGGSDDLRGELGNDVYVYGPADNDPLAVDSILDAAGRGQDRFDFTAFTQGVHADLATNTIRTADRMRIIAQGKVENAKSVCEIEDLTGSRWQDFLLGNNLANVLRGGGGDDVFWGGTAGNDSLQGEIGDDLYYVTERGANLGQVRLIEQSGQGQDTLDFTYFAALGMPIRSMGNQVFSRQTSQLLATLEGNSGYFEQWHGAL